MKRWILGPAALLSAAAGGALVKKLWLAKYREQKTELQNADRESDLLYSWLLMSQKGGSLSDYFTAHGYGKVAVFGMNREGRLLIDALGDLAVYGVEQDHPSAVHERLTVYRLGDDPLPNADCMVICDLERTQEKKDAIGREFSGYIITLDEVLAWLVETNDVRQEEAYE